VTIGSATTHFRARLRQVVQLDKVPRLARAGSILVTFALVCLGWVFFRSRSLGDALFMIRHMGDDLPHALYATMSSASARERLLYLNQGREVFLWAVAGIAALELVHAFQRHGGMRHLLSAQPAWVRWTFYYAVVLAVMLGGVFTRTQFIYFQF
jgi:hypothetical protein